MSRHCFTSALSPRPALCLEESITHERKVCFHDTSEWAFLSHRLRNGCWKTAECCKNMQKQSECSGWETGTGVPNKLWCSKHVSDVSAALKRMQCRMLFSWLFCMKIWKNNFDFQWKAAWNATFFFFRDVQNEMAAKDFNTPWPFMLVSTCLVSDPLPPFTATFCAHLYLLPTRRMETLQISIFLRFQNFAANTRPHSTEAGIRCCNTWVYHTLTRTEWHESGWIQLAIFHNPL